MSWTAWLEDDRGHLEGEWNYTHNCNGMIAAALETATGEETPPCGGPLGPAIGPAWWDRLDGADGADGAEGHAYLRAIVKGLESDPGRFRAMNPPNGWGDYGGLLTVLREMRDCLPEWPTRWSVHG